jgi:hypothetical protein
MSGKYITAGDLGGTTRARNQVIQQTYIRRQVP